jgi:hypothetical protein
VLCYASALRGVPQDSRGVLLDSQLFHVIMSIRSIALALAAFAALTASGCEDGQPGRDVPSKAELEATGQVTLSGKAQSCHPGMPIRLVGVRGVTVSAFQASKVRTLLSYLNAMDTTTIADSASMMRKGTLWSAADSVANVSMALVRVLSDSLGNFRLSIPVTDSVLVYAVGHDEDEPFDEVHIILDGRANSSFVLDMAHGGCTP